MPRPWERTPRRVSPSHSLRGTAPAPRTAPDCQTPQPSRARPSSGPRPRPPWLPAPLLFPAFAPPSASPLQAPRARARAGLCSLGASPPPDPPLPSPAPGHSAATNAAALLVTPSAPQAPNLYGPRPPLATPGPLPQHHCLVSPDDEAPPSSSPVEKAPPSHLGENL